MEIDKLQRYSDYNDLSDKDLLFLLSNNNSKYFNNAFKVIVNRYETIIFDFIRRVYINISFVEQQDILQDVWVKFYHKNDKISIINLENYLKKMSSSIILDKLRIKKNHFKLDENIKLYEVASPSRLIKLIEDRDIINRIFKFLEENESEENVLLFKLKYQEGFTMEEINQIIQIDSKTLYKRLDRMRIIINNFLKNAYYKQ
jgi:RNA polymerase sigma factor (sigma-70 family)